MKNMKIEKQSTMSSIFRNIEKKDNLQVAELIRNVMTEFECVGEGYSINDAELEDMYNAYDNDRSAFFVIEEENVVLGCGGIAPVPPEGQGNCVWSDRSNAHLPARKTPAVSSSDP